MNLFDSKITGFILVFLIGLSFLGMVSSICQVRILCYILCVMSMLNLAAYDWKKQERKRKSRLAKKIIHSEDIKIRH